MSRSSISKEAAWKNSNEGTSARTRPVNVEEILSRRKKKSKTDGNEDAGQTRESFDKDDKRISSGRGSDKKKDVTVTRKGDSKRSEETASRRDRLKEGVNNKEILKAAISKREHEHLQSKDKRSRDSETKMKEKSHHNKSTRDRESKDEMHSHHRSRISSRTAEKESEKKQAKISKETDKHQERERKSGKEAKRKHESHTDDKNRLAVDGSIPKKHDSGKLHDTGNSDRKDQKKENSRMHHEEPRVKRRRSSSQEYDQERNRPASISPRAHGHSNHRRDYDEAVLQFPKDKPRRKYSDAGDMYRTSGNGGYGSSGHYRKHGSGLGGYSPRKRRTEAAVRTPSPTKRSPEKKSSTWDQPPSGTGHGGSGSMFGSLQLPPSKTYESVSSAAVTPSTKKPQPILSLDGISILTNASIESVQLTQATRPLRRLYIENLPPSASEKLVIDCLNDFLLSSGVNRIHRAKPCISCIINKEKCQAVVEFLTPEDATLAISFDGRSLSGSVLKIKRPKDFVEAASGAQEKVVPTVKAISEVVKDSPHKIFIGGVSKALSSKMLLEIVGAFGPLRAYHFEFNEELNGQCAFLEYEDHSITQRACAGLNGMKVGGRVLTAVQTFLESEAIEDDAEELPSYHIPSHAKSLLADPTHVLRLKNVLTLEEFMSLSDSELDEVLEDVRLECARFGTVRSINLVPFNDQSNKNNDAAEGSDRGVLLAESANCKEDDADTPKLNSVKEQDVVDAIENDDDTENDDATKNGHDKMTLEDYGRKGSTSPMPTDREVEMPCSPDTGSEANADQSLDLESGSVSEVPLQQIDIDVAEENIADVKEHASEGEAGQKPVETENSSIFPRDEGKLANGDSNQLPCEVEVLEPGCVLVEFLRQEAACAAAHCLHHRLYGERIVYASYISYDLYMKRFPR